MTARANSFPEAGRTVHGECAACGAAPDNANSKPDTRRGASKAAPLTEAVRRAGCAARPCSWVTAAEAIPPRCCMRCMSAARSTG